MRNDFVHSNVSFSKEMIKTMCVLYFGAGSECNCSTLTFDGVDLMGERLAKEVITFSSIPSYEILLEILSVSGLSW